MSGAWPPPPGEQPQQGAATPPTPTQFATPPAWPQQLPPAHKPGAVPLRPLGLGDMLDGAFRLVRFNPGATVGASVLVAAVAMAIPLVVTGTMTFTGDSLKTFGSALEDPDYQPGGAEVVGIVAAVGSLLVGMILQGFGTILVAGMISHVAHAAAIGKKLTLTQAWAATHGNRWRLIGLAVLFAGVALLALGVAVALIVLVAVVQDSPLRAILAGVLLGLLLFVAAVFVSVRFYLLAVPSLMLERTGVIGAVRRAWQLSKGQFWRLLGIALLASIIAGFASQIIGFPISIIASVVSVAVPDLYFLATITGNALATVVAAAIATPFTGAVTNLQYLDQRIRKESYEVELMEQAGLLSR
ncbi:glycerophosphoryl diester phosphodiesterase family protein [Nocardioides albertanoniae]|uniref:Glycerophosphoryl diester phosphodiesterase family protein n=1 Tax=Nocardioides albertanoniae TaxID=1175486 RepID=A0A543A3G3_9ACTN|nr:glycerophosphoryl diester phosphodiesterase membrane domain-containing protein [Nocardioides albertanoniae]TQL67119.1 glycerophosphoryl diester phosphodiesterase family protein [Nocardioides albertanoniae]